MRASYTAGFVTMLLEQQLYFDYVAGISAGSSHASTTSHAICCVRAYLLRI